MIGFDESPSLRSVYFRRGEAKARRLTPDRFRTAAACRAEITLVLTAGKYTEAQPRDFSAMPS